MSWLHETKIKKKSWFMPTISTFITDKVNLRQAGRVSADESVMKVLTRCYSCSFCVFVLDISSAGVFKGGDNIVCGEIPGIMVLS